MCQTDMFLPLWESKRRKFCGRACYGLHQKQSSLNKNSRDCKFCEEVFIKNGASRGIYCSVICYWNDSFARQVIKQCIDCDIKISQNKKVKRCLKCLGKSRRGSNHPRWVEDRSKLQKEDRRGDSAYREWRHQVWLRDSFSCKIGNPDCEGRIEAHHILRWSEFVKLRYEVNNGITLCHFHHPRKINEEMNLVPLYKELINEKTL